MSERLRDLLEQAVPDDAPVLEPHALAAAARRRRNRGRAVGAGVAAAVLAVATVATVAGTRGDDRPTVARETDPYAVRACPAEPERSSADVPAYDGLVGVRLCADGGGPAADGLVELDDLPARVAALPDFDPGRCAAIDFVATRQVLRFGYADGTTAQVPATMCAPATVAGHEVDGGDLLAAYLDALAAQRERLPDARAYDGPFDCASRLGPSPAQPGRERITSGAVCLGIGPAEPLTADQLARVADAWDHPGPLTFGKCQLSVDEPLSLMLGTDHGDVVQVFDGCRTLTWTGWTPDRSASLPVSMADLGITP